MNDYIKFLIEEIKKEKAIEYNTGYGDKNSKEVISPISFIEKKEKTIENINKENSFKEENVIDYSLKTVEKENIIIDSNVGIDDKSNHSLVAFDSMYEDKKENEMSFEINTIGKEQVEVEHEVDEINKTTSNIPIAKLKIEKKESSISTPSSTLNKTEVNVTPNYEEIDKIGKLVESSSLTGAVDYIADSFGKPYLSISGFSFFDWKAFEEKTMRPVYNKFNYYPEESTASRLASYAGLGADIAEADLVGIASSVWDIASFTIGGKKKDINNRRHDLLIKPEYNEFDKGKDEEYFAETENNFEKERTETGFTFTSDSGEYLDTLIYKNQKEEDDYDSTKDKTVYGKNLEQLISDDDKENNRITEKDKTVEEKEDNFEKERTGNDLKLTSNSGENLEQLISKNQKEDDLDLTKNKTVEEKEDNFEEEKTGTELSLTSDSGENLEQLISKNQKEDDDDDSTKDKTVEEKGDFKEEKAGTELTLTSDSEEILDKLISKNQKKEDDLDPTKDKTVEEKEDNFEENKTENDLTLISGDGEIDPDFKKEKTDSNIDINYDYNFYKIRNSEEYNSIGYIYVSPVNDDAVSGSKFIRIPLQSNLVNNGETLKAEYNTTDFLGRIGSVQQYIRTGSQTFSLETYYRVDANAGYNGYTMKDLQKIEMMYKSLMFPKLKEVETDGTNIGYSFYTRPPIINIEIGNLNEFKNPSYSNSTLPDLNNSDNSSVINNFFTRVNYSEGTLKVNFKDFIVTDLEITKDYEKTPFYLEKKEYTINDNKINLYSPKDLMGFKVSLTVTEIDPNYFGILPSFNDYAKFATRA